MKSDRKISHGWSSISTKIPSSDGPQRSGRGVAVPAFSPQPNHFGRLQRPPFMAGNAGSPSSSTDVTASQIMQTTFNDEDIEDYKRYADDAPYDTERTYIEDSLLRTYIRQLLEKQEIQDEMSGCGAVAGVVVPLGQGAGPVVRSKKRRKKKR